MSEKERLNNKVQELEAELVEHVKIPLKVANEIKAEGIWDMLSQFDMEEMADCEGQYLSVNLMYEYKRQLESKDE